MTTVLDSKTIKLSDFKVGRWGRIKSYLPSATGYRQKLLAMGLTPGTLFQVTRLAPLGDPIQLLVRGYALSLRKIEIVILDIEWLGDIKLGVAKKEAVNKSCHHR